MRSFLVAVVALASCGPAEEEEQPLSQTSQPISFREIDSRIIQPRCASCHGAPDDDRSTAAALTYRRMFDRPSVRLPDMDLVEPGDPESSFVYRKLTDTQGAACEEFKHAAFGCGSFMPLPRLGEPLGPMPAEEIAFFRRWIEDGAAP